MSELPKSVPVWDPLVRIGHWTLVAAFVTAYLTTDDALEVHEWAGYVAAAYVVVRVIWGFVGTNHARFADFVFGPRQAITYLRDMVRHRAKRYIGHSPAGSIMVFALLFMLAGTTLTGMAELAAAEGEGPFSVLIQQRPSSGPAGGQVIPDGEKPESTLREVHELFANAALILIFLHIVGVIAASTLHRENLVLSMVTGRKAADPAGPR